MMELMSDVYDGLRLRTVNLCCALAIAFCKNTCWLAMYLYQ
ncbi:hypothetical protein [Nostoc sp.]